MSEEESWLRFQLEKLSEFDSVGFMVKRALIKVSVESDHIYGLTRKSMWGEYCACKVLKRQIDFIPYHQSLSC